MTTTANDLSKLSAPQRARRSLCAAAGDIYLIRSSEGPYTLRSGSFELAAIAIFALTGGQAAIASLDGKKNSVFSHAWPDFQRDILKIDEIPAYLEKHALAIAHCLDTVLYGSLDERCGVERRCDRLDNTDLLPWLSLRNQQRGITAYSLKCKAERAAEAFITKHRKGQP